LVLASNQKSYYTTASTAIGQRGCTPIFSTRNPIGEITKAQKISLATLTG